MDDLPNEYLTWLEETAQEMLKHEPVSAGVVFVLPDGNVMTAYYMADQTDKALMAHNIYADAVLDIVLNNAQLLREAMEEDGYAQ